eukprot:5262074-Prymnesium_polylepis.1
MVEGPKARMYTRESATVRTRIDRVCGPARMESHEWLGISTLATFGRSDHTAILATLAPITHANDPKKHPTIRRSVYNSDSAQSAIASLFTCITTDYNPEHYGYAVVWEKFKASSKDLLLQHSADTRRNAPLLGILKQSLQDNKKNAPPSKERMQASKRLSDKINEEATNKRIYQAKTASDKIYREERNTKTFNASYKQTQTRKPIPKLYHMEGTTKAPPDETTGETPTADDVSGMTQVSAGYYEALMGEKITSKRARDTLTAKLAERPFSASAAAKLEGAITEKDVRQQIRKLARGKACGPDGIAAEFYRIHEDLLAGFLTATLNEMHEEG